MKKRYNFTLDAELYEECAKIVDNMSAFINNCIRKRVATHRTIERSFDGKGYTKEEQKEFERKIDIASTPWQE